MFESFVEWLNSLTPAAGSFLGTVTGSLLGLLALLSGALFNAHLNRRRDDRLRRLEKRSLASALKAELMGFRRQLAKNAEGLDDESRFMDGKDGFLLPDVSYYIRVFPELIGKLGMFEPEAIHDIIKVYALLEEYSGRIILVGGKAKIDPGSSRPLFVMSKDRAKFVAELNRNIIGVIDAALERLKVELA